MVEIGNREYPFAFTYKCMKELVKFDDLDELGQSEKAFELAINKGFEREGSKERITRKELVDLLDTHDDAFAKLSAALTRDMGKLTGEGKK